MVRKRENTIRLHGKTWSDPYFWLRDKKNPEVMKVLRNENEHFQSEMKPLKKRVSALYRELKRRVPAADSSVPAKWGPFEYRSEFRKGDEYKRHLRRKIGDKSWTVYFDQNKAAKGKKYFALGGFDVSDDHRWIAYSSDFDGSEKYSIRMRDLSSGKECRETLLNSSGDCAWAADARHLFYVVIDKNLRPYRIYRHQRGTSPQTDELIFEEKDPQQFLSLSKSSSGDFILIESHGKVTSEIWYLRSADPLGSWTCFEPRREGHEYSLDHGGTRFYVLSNARHQNFELFSAPAPIAGVHPRRAQWSLVEKGQSAIYRTSISVFKDYVVLGERADGLPQYRVLDLKSHRSHTIDFPDAAYEVSLDGGNHEFETNKLRIVYSSPVQPDQVREYDMRNRKQTVLKTQKINGFQRSRYKCERLFVRSHDGVKVPLTVVSRVGRKKSGPGYLYGYGSYGYSMADSFGRFRDAYSLIDRGFVVAIAHIRGGSEMGRHWYESGKYLRKMNTFHDFNACGEFLIRSGRVAKARLGIAGASAGGMLVGAALNLRPDLYGAVAAHVPFVDVLNTMMDKSLPLTPTEFKEWGNPDEKKYFDVIRKYSPYDNVAEREYPPLFVTAGLNDPRVTYWEPAKWVARIREKRTNKNALLFKINMGAGHFGASGRFGHLVEKAEEYAFMLKALC